MAHHSRAEPFVLMSRSTIPAPMSYGYVPTPPPPAAGTTGQPYAGQLRSQKKRTRIIVVAAIAVVLLIGLFVGGLITMIFGFLRSSEPYQHAVQMATTDP